MIFQLFEDNLTKMCVLLVSQDEDLAAQIDVDKILNETELLAARQAFNIIQGALSSVPVMGLQMYESALEQARQRFSLIGNPVLRQIVIQNFNLTIATFLQGLSDMTCPEAAGVKVEKETEKKSVDPTTETTVEDNQEVGGEDGEDSSEEDLDEDEDEIDEEDEEEDEDEEI